MTTLSQAIDQYLVIRRAKYAKGTTRCDTQDLRRLLAATGNVRVKDLTKDMFVSYFYGAKGRVNAVQASTFNAERARIASFLNWCVEENLVSSSPMRGIDRRRVGQRERLRLEPETMIELIQGEPYLRDRLVLVLGCTTGLRAHSITDLRVGDVDLAGGWLRTRTTKTGIEKLKPITLELDRELRFYLAWYQGEAGPLQSDWFLTPARHRYGWYNDPVTGRRMDDVSVIQPTVRLGYQTALRITHNALKRVGLDAPGEGMHTLRRSAGRALFEAGVAEGDARAIHVVREFYDHQDVAMSERYIGTNNERKQLEERMRGKIFLTPLGATDEQGTVVDLAAMRRKRRG